MILFLAYPFVCVVGLACTGAGALWRWYCYREPRYIFSSLKPFARKIHAAYRRKHVLFFMRCLGLASLSIALGRLQAPDTTSRLPVQGTDIMLVLDVSDSMTCIDDPQDPRSRIEIACTQACKFIDKRPHDALGLVLFAGEVVSRCPCTQDKQLVKELINESSRGIIDSRGTLLSKALVCAINRLKDSTAPSKIVIALTDGVPTEGDIDHHIAIELAQKLQIKIYTIGIGSPDNGLVYHPLYLYGLVSSPYALNTTLLQEIATATQGQFFLAKNPQEIEKIYAHIDALEKHEQQTPLFARYTEYFMPFLVLAFICCSAEVLLVSLWWLGL